jgi:hypothetical protein
VGTRGPNLGTYIAEGWRGREREREREGAGVLVSGRHSPRKKAGSVALQRCVSFREAHGGVVNLNYLHSAWVVSSLSIFGLENRHPTPS